MNKLGVVSSNLFVYGLAHAVVDAISSGVIFSILKNQLVGAELFFALIIFYNVLAFGLQTIFGLISDHFESPRATTFLGCVFVAISAATFFAFPIIAIILVGLGNALFHVGGGSISLNLTPRKAAAPGVFVAPGALGLLVGTLLGNSGQFIVWPFVLVLAILCSLMFVVKKPEVNFAQEPFEIRKFSYLEAILILVFLSIAVRSLVGMVLVFPWKSDFSLLVILTIAVVLGKGLGGFLADKFGWVRIAVGALVLSIPFLAFGAQVSFLGIAGMFLFNITMPITLVVFSNILPGRPGFAFGLTCLALIVGALPGFFPIKSELASIWFVVLVVVVSAAALYSGLRLYFRKFMLSRVDY